MEVENEPKPTNLFDRGITKEVDEKVAEEIDNRLKRRIEARKGKRGNPYWGLIFMGMVGWSFAVPFVLSVGIGFWLSKKFLFANYFILLFIVIGLMLGILNVSFVIKKESRFIKHKNKQEEM